MLNTSKLFVNWNLRSFAFKKKFLLFINMSTNVRTLRTRANVKTESEIFKKGGKKGNFDAAVVSTENDNPTVVLVRQKSTNKKTGVNLGSSLKSTTVSEIVPNLKNPETKNEVGPKNVGMVSKVEEKSAKRRSGNVKIKTENCCKIAEQTETTSKVSIKCEPLDDIVPNKEKTNVESITGKIARKRNTTSTKNENKPIHIKINICDMEDEVPMDSTSIPTSTMKSPRKRRQLKTETDAFESEKLAKTIKQEVEDIENAPWEPSNWKQVWENILKMRKMHVAPVDSLGCEECPDKGVSPEIHRYQTLVSVMLSSQTRDEVTYAATQHLIEHGLNVDNILRTPDEKIGELIYPAGFWKSKVQYIKRTTQILKDQYNGDIPRTFKELCKLPGVGPKMANIVMSVGWNDTVGIAVDTHVHRISNRLGWVKKPTKDPEQTRKALESWLPKDLWRPVNVTLVGFGQTICRPIGPSCSNCQNNNMCPFGRNELAGKNKKKPKKLSQ